MEKGQGKPRVRVRIRVRVRVRVRVLDLTAYRIWSRMQITLTEMMIRMKDSRL